MDGSTDGWMDGQMDGPIQQGVESSVRSKNNHNFLFYQNSEHSSEKKTSFFSRMLTNKANTYKSRARFTG